MTPPPPSDAVALTARRAAQLLERHRAALVARTVDVEWARRPALAARWGEPGRQRCLEDAGFHLSFLECALVMREPRLFTDYVRWLVALLAARGVGADDVAANLAALGDVVDDALPLDEARVVRALLADGVAVVAG